MKIFRNSINNSENLKKYSEVATPIIKNFGGKKLPSVIEFVPLEKEGNKTIVERLIWKFDIDINERFFMPNYMKNLR